MAKIRSIFVRGLLTFLPMAVTIYILYAGILIVENFLGSVLREVLPHYIPGLGFVLTILLIFLFGLLLNNLIMEELLKRLELNLKRIPLVKAVYSPVKDLLNLFSNKGHGGLQSVVLVNIGGVQMLGLMTRDNFRDLQDLQHYADDKVSVFLPFSYTWGGYTVLVPRSAVTPVNIPVEKALSLSVTAWVKSPEQKPEDIK
ncbi:MAG: DUF502 domain-containing protein [Bdellovibrionaceae bacterium]|nr:DUF502 domain-containing protein [Pseudobdellovibrionaceae bacterium]